MAAIFTLVSGKDDVTDAVGAEGFQIEATGRPQVRSSSKVTGLTGLKQQGSTLVQETQLVCTIVLQQQQQQD